MADIRPPLGPLFSAFGVPALVTPKGGAPVSTVVIWAPQRPDRMLVSAASGFGEVDVRPVVAIRRDAIATLPIGSGMVAPETDGGASKHWLVDRLAPENPLDPELWHAVVHEVPA